MINYITKQTLNLLYQKVNKLLDNNYKIVNNINMNYLFFMEVKKMQNVLEKQEKSIRKSVKIFHFNNDKDKYIKLSFKYDPELINSIKKISGVKWDNENKFWYIPNTSDNLKSIYKNLKEDNIYIDSTMFFNRFNEYKKDTIKKYSEKLNESDIEEKENYLNNFNYFINTFKNEDISYLSFDEINNYISNINEKVLLNGNNINTIVKSINFYYNNVLDKNEKFLNKEEFDLFLNSIDNIKHKIIFYLLFYTDFTKDEISNLCIFDYVEEEKMIYSESGNSKKFFIPEKLCNLFNEYIKEYKLESYLFEGKNNNKLKPESIELLVDKKIKKVFQNKTLSYKAFNRLFKNELEENIDQNTIKIYYENLDLLNKSQKQKIIRYINSAFIL